MKIITGEQIQLSCNQMIGFRDNFNWNPRIREAPESQKIYLEDEANQSTEINNGSRVFCYTDILVKNYNDLASLIKRFSNSFTLVFHNSDYAFQVAHLKIFEETPKLCHIQTQNMNVVDLRVTPLPIGIANSMWPHGNLEAWRRIKLENIPKTNAIYFNFNLATTHTRHGIYRELAEILPVEPNREYSDYLRRLASFKFAICPEGNGIDTHRMWECLYLGVIPICQTSILTTHYAKMLPIVLVNGNSWAETVRNLDVTAPGFADEHVEMLDQITKDALGL